MALSKYTRTRLLYRDGKKVRAHRWIMEQHLGRKLLPTEHVHHINKNPLDNRIENLQVMDAKEHISMHTTRYSPDKVCEWCGADFVAKPKKRLRQKTCSPACAYALRGQNISRTKQAKKAAA